VHMVRHSLNYVSWKLRKVVAADLKTIYAAATVDEVRISAIVDACFNLIVDGVSEPSWTRRGCAQANLCNVSQLSCPGRI
jgi:hypothetical protein